MIQGVNCALMSVLFHQSSVSPPAWVSTPLRVGQALLLGPCGGSALMVADRVSAVEEGAWLLVRDGAAGGGAVHHLLAGRGSRVRIGGHLLVGGLKRLERRREEIVVGGRPFFLSLDEAARVEPYTGEDPVRCARCKGLIEPGSKHVVRCPKCQLAYHEDESGGLCCFTAGVCVGCGGSHLLGEENAWTPEAL
jgi:hypothetical protein